MTGRIVLREGDITEQEVDAIVNAANSDLVLGAGVAGIVQGNPLADQLRRVQRIVAIEAVDSSPHCLKAFQVNAYRTRPYGATARMGSLNLAQTSKE